MRSDGYLSNSLILLTVVMKQKHVFYPSVKWPVIANFLFFSKPNCGTLFTNTTKVQFRKDTLP